MNVQARSLEIRDATNSLPSVSKKYITSGNHTIYIPGGAKIGDYVWTPPKGDDEEFDVSEIIGHIDVAVKES